MSFSALFFLALGLAMDATAVSAARSLAAPRIFARDVAKVALLFGGFQALMPLLGAWLGHWVGPWLEAWQHWVVFAVLGGIGAKMLWEARSTDEDDAPASERGAGDPFAWRVLLVLAVATSIDAFAVGLTLPMLGVSVPVALAMIGVVTAVSSALGMLVGRKFGALLGRKLDAFGGLVLVALGIKSLVEHFHG